MVSETGPEGFASLGTVHIDLDFTPQLFTFAPVRARFVKLRVLSNHGAGQVALGEVEVAGADDVRGARERDRKSQPEWAALPVEERVRYLEGALRLVIDRQDEIV